MSEQNRYEFELKLLNKLLREADEKERFLANPKLYLEGELDTQLPADLVVQAVEEDASNAYIVLPDPIHTFLGELYASTIDKQIATGYSRKTIEALVVERALTNPVFRQEVFYDNPRSGFIEAMGLNESQLPADFKVTILEENPTLVYLVVPFFRQDSILAYFD